MKFHVYFPPAAETASVPVVYWLSGLTCTDENFIIKSGVQRSAAQYGIAVVVPDTSPRGLGLPGESESYDFGVGASFYLNATKEPWSGHWKMYDYITSELPGVLKDNFENLDVTNAAIMGHSMGGHGALTIFLKNPQMYKSASAFAPVVQPTKVPWGLKAFTGYLGNDQNDWKQYDACELMKTYSGPEVPLLVDTGDADEFLQKQLRPWLFEFICKERNYPLTIRLHEGYDHSYFFIASFIDDHMLHHAKALGTAPK